MRRWVWLVGLMGGWITLAALLAVLPAWASGPIGQDVPGPRSQDVQTGTNGCIEVRQQGKRVQFEVFWVDVDGNRMVPLQAYRLVVRPTDQDKYIWDVVGQDYAETQRITYGIVPKGFVQKVPLYGQPPALVPGAKYEVYAHTRDAGSPLTSFVYQRAEAPRCPP